MNRDRFCPSHDHLNSICAVDNCSTPIEIGHATCALSNHRLLETEYRRKDKAFFQLIPNLQRPRVSNPNDALGTAERADFDITEEIQLAEDNPDPACPSKDPEGNRKLRALFGRRRSHNEQIVVAPCGMILIRKTFMGSETVPQVVVHLVSLLNCLSILIDLHTGDA
jgi:hypothetical protein